MYNEEVPYTVIKPDNSEKAKKYRWSIAFGLQAVDGLKPSKFMRKLADKHIKGIIDKDELKKELEEYYSDEKNSKREGEKQADNTSSRIDDMLADETFIFEYHYLEYIHKYLFEGIFKEHPVGKFRNDNISKNEAVLNGISVKYSPKDYIENLLERLFEKEKQVNYNEYDEYTKVMKVTKYMSEMWQIHPFREGNTRTIAVFIIKYLNNLGFDIDNKYFEKHSQHFRDTLVLDNAIPKEPEYLIKFMQNAVLKMDNEIVDLRKMKYLYLKF